MGKAEPRAFQVGTGAGLATQWDGEEPLREHRQLSQQPSRAATTRSSSPPCEAAAWGPEPQPSATRALTAGTDWRRLPRAGAADTSALRTLQGSVPVPRCHRRTRSRENGCLQVKYLHKLKINIRSQLEAWHGHVPRSRGAPAVSAPSRDLRHSAAQRGQRPFGGVRLRCDVPFRTHLSESHRRPGFSYPVAVGAGSCSLCLFQYKSIVSFEARYQN